MSEQDQDKIQVEPLTELFIDASDVQSIRDFFEHFSIPFPDSLKEVCKEFEENAESEDKLMVVQLQNKLRVELCRTMVESESPVFKSPLLSTVINNSQSILFNAKFDEQVREMLKKEEQ